MRKIKRIIMLVILAGTVIYLSGCASLTYSPHKENEKIKVTFAR